MLNGASIMTEKENEKKKNKKKKTTKKQTSRLRLLGREKSLIPLLNKTKQKNFVRKSVKRASIMTDHKHSNFWRTLKATLERTEADAG